MNIEPDRKIFLTGGSGFIGSRIVRKLCAEGYQVKCLLRPTSKTDRIEGFKYQEVIGDILDMESLEKGMKDCDAVIHLACISNWAEIHSPKMYQVVFEGTRNLLQAAKNAGHLPTIYVSSAAAINGSKHPQVFDESSAFELPEYPYAYAFAKHKAEMLCFEFEAQGLPMVIVNPTEVYGPEDRDLVTSGTLLGFAKSPIVAFAPHGGTSIVHVDDVAAGIVAALHRGRSGERYILGGENLSFSELAALTLSLLKQKKKVITLPTPVFRFLVWFEKTTQIKIGADPAVAPYAMRYWYMNSSKAQRELGVSFRPPEAILKSTLEWFKDVGKI